MKLLDFAIPGWARLVGGLLVGLCIAWLLAVVKGWHDDSQTLPGVKQELKESRRQTEQVRAEWKAEATRLVAINEGLSNENQILRDQRAAIPVRSVRLCSAARPASPADPAAAGRVDEAAAGAGVLQEEGRWDPEPGPDIGPELYALMDEADDMLRRYRGLQQWAAGLPAACLSGP